MNNYKQLKEKMKLMGIVPVVVLEDTAAALPLANALCNGGLPCAEVTFRTSAAEESIRIMTQNYPNMLIGAGTILTIEQAEKAVHSGASFLVSPCFDPELVDYCIGNDIPILPGCVSPSEFMKGIKHGLSVLKFFPAEQSGGPSMIKALSAIYRTTQFFPTGGINAKNLASYLALPSVIACGGSWMVKDFLISSGKFDKIEQLTREAVSIVESIRD